MADRSGFWYWIKIIPILFLIGVVICTCLLAAANTLPKEIRARVLLGLAIYLALGFATLNFLQIKLHPLKEPAPHQFVKGVKFMARRALFVLTWPVATVCRLICRSG